jgi:DNA-binding NarL/FixJ family response regulator
MLIDIQMPDENGFSLIERIITGNSQLAEDVIALFDPGDRSAEMVHCEELGVRAYRPVSGVTPRNFEIAERGNPNRSSGSDSIH